MAEGAPCEVWFYHLEQMALDQALPSLLERTLQRGWRALIRSPLSERVEHLDGWLWAYKDDSFLPHGVESEPLADRQPVLITKGMDNANAAQCLFLIDNAEPGDLSGFERCILLFDGRDPQAVGASRERWREFKTAGLPVAYWRQTNTGKWEKQA